MLLKFRTPVVCQNGHKAFWYWYISSDGIGEVKHNGVPNDQKCYCSKQALGEGYVRAGSDQMFTGWYERDASGQEIHGKEIYESDIVVASYHWTEWHVVELPRDFYDVSEFALADDLSIRGNVFMNPEMVEAVK